MASGAPLAPERDHTRRGVDVVLQDLIRLRAEAPALGLSYQSKIRSVQCGGYISPYRGRGVDFDESRAYQPGDDIRYMDWRVTARSGQPHTKVYREERQRPVIFVVDQGPSMCFGTRVAFKTVTAARAAAVIAWAAADNGDRVGGLVFSESNRLELRPSARRAGVLHLCRALATVRGDELPDPCARTSALSETLKRLDHIARPGSLVFIVSDFYGYDSDSDGYLRHLRHHNDVVLVLVYDPIEAEAPQPGYYPVTDGRARMLLNTHSTALRARYSAGFEQRCAGIRDACRQLGLHFLTLASDAPLVPALRRGLHRYGGQATRAI